MFRGGSIRNPATLQRGHGAVRIQWDFWRELLLLDGRPIAHARRSSLLLRPFGPCLQSPGTPRIHSAWMAQVATAPRLMQSSAALVDNGV
ncbi:hypothetical protein AXG53_00600 [Stenotrophomonas sp. KCTC 12332]|nr:hypothetical protein AXG53_00600 [Stenotrophomonas sp. KCTC 12332]